MKTRKPQSVTPKEDAKAAENNGVNGEVSSMILKGGRKFLITLKQKAVRINNSWFRTLTFDKRRYIDAVIQTVDQIHSSLILKILVPLAEKLLHAIGGLQGLMGHLSYGMRTFGQQQAQQISLIAMSWGNKLASQWANNEGFIRYLTVIDMNDLSMFRVSKKL
jgi:hypothetical protein